MKFSASSRALLVAWVANTRDGQPLAGVQSSCAPVRDIGHQEGLPENN